VGLLLPSPPLSLSALGFGYFTSDWAIFVVFVKVSRNHDFLLKLVLEDKNLHVPSTAVESGNGNRESHGRMLYD
jgi:hypothetical protein